MPAPTRFNSRPTSKYVWYVQVNGQLVGPLTTEKLRLAIQEGEIPLDAKAWLPADPRTWVSLSLLSEFKDLENELAPTIQTDTRKGQTSPRPEIRTATKRTKKNEKKIPPNAIWFVQFKDAQSGPFTVTELDVLLRFENIKPPVRCWRPGMEVWAPIDQIAELKPFLKKAPPLPKSDSRTAERVTMMATVAVQSKTSRTVGICKNISVGGMQVLGSLIPGPAGSEHQFKIFPEVGLGVPAFQVRGTIIRILSDRPGFAVKFLDLPSAIGKVLAKKSK